MDWAETGVAPDGSPVALYLAVPGDEDATFIHAAMPTGAAVLELGCGVGRVTRHLAAMGHAVTGVDNSPEMLAQLLPSDGIDTVETSSAQRYGMTMAIRVDGRPAPGMLAATMLYDVGAAHYEHAFTAYDVEDARLDEMAAAVGLRDVAVINEAGSWVRLGDRD